MSADGSRAPVVTVVGAGVVGARCARELLTPGSGGERTVGAVRLVTRRPARAEELTTSFGTEVAVSVAGDGSPDLAGSDVVVVTRRADEHLDVVDAALRAGVPVVSTSDDPEEVRGLLALDPLARTRGVGLVLGATFAPGLSCLLTRLAARELDEVREIHVARHGAGGPSCARQRRRALRGTGHEWRDGVWIERAGFSGRELCWFPDPIGGRDCYRADLAEPPLLVDAFPDVERVTARLAATRRDRVLVPLPMLIGPPVEGGPGAVRVEVRGTRDGARADVVLGVLDRPSVAAGAVAAVTALAAATGRVPTGAHGLAAVAEPGPILRELARRGVRAARFEGSDAVPLVPEEPGASA